MKLVINCLLHLTWGEPPILVTSKTLTLELKQVSKCLKSKMYCKNK